MIVTTADVRYDTRQINFSRAWGLIYFFSKSKLTTGIVAPGKKLTFFRAADGMIESAGNMLDALNR